MRLLLFFLFIFLAIFLAFFIRFYHFYKITEPKGIKYKSNYVKKGFFSKILDFPKQLGIDYARKDSDFFDAHGCIVFEGRQGGGKTISAVQYARELKRRFPECLVLSNTSLDFEDLSLQDWKPLLNVKNDKYGVVCLIDEAQLWFNGRFASNFNLSCVGLISQNRKNKRVLLLTSQNFCQLDRQLRINCTELRKCFTFFGVLTVVSCFSPEMDSEGNIKHNRFKRLYWYIQDDDLRGCYDTYKVISILSKSGFIDRKE